MTTITYRNDIEPADVQRYACQRSTIKYVADKLCVNSDRLSRYIKRYPDIRAAFEYGKQHSPKRSYKRKAVNRRPTPTPAPIPENGSFYKEHSKCYLKEARAMIRGKHWEGKNRCVKLPCDDDVERTA